MYAISKYYKRPLECMYDITPGLEEIPCLGPLQIDHINGGGRADYRTHGISVYRDIAHEKRSFDDFRILCALHNFAWWLFNE